MELDGERARFSYLAAVRVLFALELLAGMAMVRLASVSPQARLFLVGRAAREIGISAAGILLLTSLATKTFRVEPEASSAGERDR